MLSPNGLPKLRFIQKPWPARPPLSVEFAYPKDAAEGSFGLATENGGKIEFECASPGRPCRSPALNIPSY